MKVYVDANPNMVAYVTEGRKVMFTSPLDTPHTNNEAEYEAVIAAIRNNDGDLEILSDSQLVVKQLNFEYSIKSDSLRRFATTVHDLCKGRNITFTWTPRGKNPAGKFLG